MNNMTAWYANSRCEKNGYILALFCKNREIIVLMAHAIIMIITNTVIIIITHVVKS